MNSPCHIAIVMDGNGRWASKKNKPRKFGHKKGATNIKNIIESCIKNKIKYLTLFALSLDNFNRPKSEISSIFEIFQEFVEINLNNLNKKNIKISFIGEKLNLPRNIKKLIKITQNKTKKNNGLKLIIAFNYSSKHELLQAVKKIKNKKKVTIKSINDNLYTSKYPDPDILIRTGGYARLSNFLLWQSSYTELFFLNKMWPDFSKRDLSSIIKKFKKIKRNFGAV